LIHSGVPCINSAKAFWYNEFEKPLMFSGLKAIQDRIGKDRFPLINQYYYSNYSSMGFIPGNYPQVVKVGHMDAGMGKMKVDHEQGMKDLSSVVGVHGDYSTSEPFIEGQYDLRIQKIGNKIRAFKRTGLSRVIRCVFLSFLFIYLFSLFKLFNWFPYVFYLFLNLEFSLCRNVVEDECGFIGNYGNRTQTRIRGMDH
jgi:hypothetical protein